MGAEWGIPDWVVYGISYTANLGRLGLVNVVRNASYSSWGLFPGASAPTMSTEISEKLSLNLKMMYRSFGKSLYSLDDFMLNCLYFSTQSGVKSMGAFDYSAIVNNHSI